jgi:hypothetical protein
MLLQTSWHGMLVVTMCSGCYAGVVAVSSSSTGRIKDGGRYYYLIGGRSALHTYLGYTITAMSFQAGSTQLTLHLQSPLAAAAAEHAAEEAAAALEAAATWQVHQVRQLLLLGCSS